MQYVVDRGLDPQDIAVPFTALRSHVSAMRHVRSRAEEPPIQHVRARTPPVVEREAAPVLGPVRVEHLSRGIPGVFGDVQVERAGALFKQRKKVEKLCSFWPCSKIVDVSPCSAERGLSARRQERVVGLTNLKGEATRGGLGSVPSMSKLLTWREPAVRHCHAPM